jgi:hypothetical protein
MSISRFNSQKDTFTVLDLTARLSFKTESSLSFAFVRSSKSLLPTRHIGWIDLHYPCDGHIKLQIRISLPAEYHAPERFSAIVAGMITALEIPPDETYEARLFAESAPLEMSHTTNRESVTDRF